MLRARFHFEELALFAKALKRKTGLSVDLYEDVRSDQLRAHRENFAAAMAALPF